MTLKARAHSILESAIYNTLKTGKGRQSVLTIPHYELQKEVGFGEPVPGASIKITMTVEFIDEDGEMYDDRESATDN